VKPEGRNMDAKDYPHNISDQAATRIKKYKLVEESPVEEPPVEELDESQDEEKGCPNT
jgi:hypothetical protein